MPLLLYGVTEVHGNVLDLPTGMGGARVQRIEVSGLSCFYSLNSTLSGIPPRESALQFHGVLQAILSAQDIIPFRFPTLVTEAELQSQVQEHAAEYHEWLARVRGRVQMEIRIEYRDLEQSSGEADAGEVSGTKYLRARQKRLSVLEAAAGVLKSKAADFIQGWRQRSSSDHLRCFALVRREVVADFRHRMASAEISSDLTARISGPWPAMEFFREE